MTTVPPLSKLLDLSGKTAVVTGGAVGIGFAIAARLAEAGAAVVIADFNAEEGAKAAAKLQEDWRGARVAFVATDVSKAVDAEKAVAEAVSRFGRLDILVNNAGIFPFSPALELKEAVWDRVLAVNLKGVFLMAQAAARQMVKQGGGGAIVNIASIDAFHPTGYLAHYDASKGGVVMLTKALAKELGSQKIRVNAIAPGGVATPGAMAAAAAMGAGLDLSGFYAKLPIPRAGDPDEIGRVALFLVSEGAAYMTGATVVVDGGALIA
jgi:2-deoxy-D-gluconate 3-dehydrogenase